jgi:hypothetical protein
MRYRAFARLLALTAVMALAVAGPTSAGPLVPSPLQNISIPSPFAGCDVSGQGGTNYVNSEVEPWVAVNPTDASNIIAVWQQDRWSNGGARGLLTAASHDGGGTWAYSFAHFSSCSGGTPANGGNYERASDPWVTFSPNGDAYQISLSVNLFNNPASAILVSKSTDGGDTWSEPITVIRNTDPFLFNDKETITADPTDSNFVYAVWDRSRHPSDRRAESALNATSFRGDAMFARTTNGGQSWEPARAIFAPRENKFTIGHQIVVLPNGTLVDLFNLGQGSGGNRPFFQALMRSTDKGETWSRPFVFADSRHTGAFDPDTGLPIRAEGSVGDYAVDPDNGNLYAAWQDDRFTKKVDEIAFSLSTDGGFHWSNPIRVNQTPRSPDTANRQAWVPNVHVARDGTVGVSYYDFRFNTPAPGATTDHWLVHCHSGCSSRANWGDEVRLTDTSFDMEQAPAARGPFGFFLGEYEGLEVAGAGGFRPLFAKVNDGQPANRTDIVTGTAT